MSRDPREIAREIDALLPCFWEGKSRSCSRAGCNPSNGNCERLNDIAAAIERDRAETIERCAKVADAHAQKSACAVSRGKGEAFEGGEAVATMIAAAIRSILPSPPQEGQP